MFAQILPLAALVALVDAHGVILAAQGDAGSPPSVGFQVSDAIARNCTTISPCQMDSTIIRDAEIAAETVTENALAAHEVTQVQSGTQMQVTIHQVNADGAGPYSCDLDEGSNTCIISHNLTVTNNIPGANAGCAAWGGWWG
ncbi:GEgh16 protein [Chaetomidium leptoderma]|uniref:GEgh16 protein n=1 Tax=Chaetomidium leptoderma TaxID=669021 RepID=A0AAN6ZTU8_9PEZI|nr:GEgh16 protein [Chaetomidium leptoderma]